MKTSVMRTTVTRALRFWCIAALLFVGCEQNPLTGKRTMSFYSETELFSMADEQYREFLKENPPVPTTDPTNGANAKMVKDVGQDIAAAAQKWLEFKGSPKYLKNYRWEYNLVNDKAINAWCMPGGKIVVYTGILPVTQNRDALAVVMGHEVAHALLNHGQQRLSAGILQQLGAGIVGAFTESDLVMAVYGLTTNLAGMMPFSREHESESDHYGLILAAIAGYDPEEAVPFWERMAAQSGGGGGGVDKALEFLSTHPSHTTRINDLKGWVAEAKTTAAQINSK